MSYEFFIVETADHVSTVTLNRPDKLNALSHAMTTEFHVVLDGIEAQFPDVRAIIITGTGRGFCSGADVVEQRASLGRRRRRAASSRPDSCAQDDEHHGAGAPAAQSTSGDHSRSQRSGCGSGFGAGPCLRYTNRVRDMPGFLPYSSSAP